MVIEKLCFPELEFFLTLWPLIQAYFTLQYRYSSFSSFSTSVDLYFFLHWSAIPRFSGELPAV